MTISILQKFCIPAVASGTIHRDELIQALDLLTPHKILFIGAPAGYGKTTLAAQWILSKPRKAAWFSLDIFDTSAASFYEGILKALSPFAVEGQRERISYEFSEKASASSPAAYAMDILSKLDFTNIPDMLVIDDFQFCREQEELSLISVRSRLPAGTRLVILSRNPPPARLCPSIIKGIAKELTINELQFSCEEIKELFKINGSKISGYAAAEVKERTHGWPAAIAAIAAEGGITGDKRLRAYLKSYLYEFLSGDDRDLILKTSVCEMFDQSFCEMLTGRSGSFKAIEKLMRDTGLVAGTNLEAGVNGKGGEVTAYEYHRLLREFLLSELEMDDTIDKNSVCRDAAKWNAQNGCLTAALELAAKSGDAALVEQIQMFSRGDDINNTGVCCCAEAIDRNVIGRLPLEVIKQKPGLSAGCLFSAFALGRIAEFYEWEKTVACHEKQGRAESSSSTFIAALLSAADPKKTSWDAINEFKEAINSSAEPTEAFTITFNLPVFHRSIRDFTDISPNQDAYLAEFRKYAPGFFGACYEQLSLLLEAGILFERNELKRAKKAAVQAAKAMEGLTPEIMFSCLILLCEINWYEGNTTTLEKLLSETEKKLTDRKARYLLPNFRAYSAKLLLYEGNTDIAAKWLEAHYIEDEQCKFYKSCEYFTTARALIMTDDLSAAERFLDKISKFSEAYARNADIIEAYTLKSICMWRMKCPEKAVGCLTEAIAKARRLEIVMPIAREGADILPVLRKIQNRLKFGYDADILDKAFVNLLYINTRIAAERHIGLSSKKAGKPVKLSERQETVLKMLSMRLTYKEMSELTGIKITSVREHINKLYEKLGASNSSEALIKAEKLGLLETKK